MTAVASAACAATLRAVSTRSNRVSRTHLAACLLLHAATTPHPVLAGVGRQAVDHAAPVAQDTAPMASCFQPGRALRSNSGGRQCVRRRLDHAPRVTHTRQQGDAPVVTATDLGDGE